MEAGCTIPFRGGRCKIVGLAALRDTEVWTTAFASKAKDHRFYEIVEETLACGFEHQYLLFEDEFGRVRAVVPSFFVQQSLVEGVPALRSAVALVRRKFPRFLTLRVIMIGCAVGEGHLGICDGADEDWVAIALLSTLEIYARKQNAALVVLKDFAANYRPLLERFSSAGYRRIPSMPMTTLELPFTSFEEYLGSLGKATRKDLRRKFRRISQAAPMELEVLTDIAPLIEEVYPLYLQVHERSPQKFERLTKDYFRALGTRMADRARFFVWRQNRAIVAFSVCLLHNGTIHDECLGLDYNIALDLYLYFHTFRDTIAWALRHGVTSYQSSPLGYRPKLHLGCKLLPLDLYVMHTNCWLQPLFGGLVQLLEPTRHDRVLREFPNADQLKH